MGKLNDVNGFKIVTLAVQHIERVEDFIREHIQLGKIIFFYFSNLEFPSECEKVLNFENKLRRPSY